jgi:excisionase family DNA binding protein
MTALHDDFLTVAEAAAILRVAPSTIRRWIRAGQLPAYRLGSRRLALRRDDLAELVSPVSPDANGSETMMAANSTNRAGERAQRIGRRLTAEEVRRGLKTLERARRQREEITARRGGKLFPSSWSALNEMRDERYRQVTGE